MYRVHISERIGIPEIFSTDRSGIFLLVAALRRTSTEWIFPPYALEPVPVLLVRLLPGL